jgi:hypothetical protein
MAGQLYQITVNATGEVRDADGNLVSSSPVSTEWLVTEDELKALLEGDN